MPQAPQGGGGIMIKYKRTRLLLPKIETYTNNLQNFAMSIKKLLKNSQFKFTYMEWQRNEGHGFLICWFTDLSTLLSPIWQNKK